MDIWHTCDTTHCRAGWVIHLAGEEGKKLENLLTTPIAAALIYKESSQIEVKWTHRFYESNTQAMADIKRCADEEIILNKKEIK